MTIQMSDLAVKRGRDRWEFTAADRFSGNSAIHVLADNQTSLLTLSLVEHLHGFLRFAHWTTAGMNWTQHMLAYFIELDQQHYFVVRAWWGSRLVIELDAPKCVAPTGFESALIQFEREFVLRELKAILSEAETGNTPKRDRSSAGIMATLHSCLFLPGALELFEAVPVLRLLESYLVPPETQWGDETLAGLKLRLCYERRLVQNSLRRLGAKPSCSVYLIVESDSERVHAIPEDRKSQVALAAGIVSGISVSEAIRMLGMPDYIERAGDAHDADGLYYQKMLRYEIDAEAPYTLLLRLNRQNDIVARCVKYSLPFWYGPDIFPSNHSLLGHDGETVVSFIDDLDNGTFVGDTSES